MPNPLNDVAVADDYTVAASIQNIFPGAGGAYVVKLQPVYAQLQYGVQGAAHWTDEQILDPGGGAIDPGATGIQFRNATAGQAAIVSARIKPRAQPGLAVAFASTVGPSVVTGRVSSVGGIVSGTGFTVTKGAAGIYTINFNTAFTGGAPIVVAMAENASWLGASITALSASAVTLRWVNIAFNPTDTAFEFLANAII